MRSTNSVPALLGSSLLALAALAQPAWACKNAMEPTGPNAVAFWATIAVPALILFFVGYYIYSNMTSKD